jgi:ribosomal protein S27AE
VSDDLDDDDWLHPRVLDCPACGLRLFRVDHSPMIDDYRLYCDRCPRAIEISLYDDTLSATERRLPAGHDRRQLMAAVEPRLRPCRCGGRYRDAAPRRCFRCNAEVVADDPAGVDLSPYIGPEDQGREPTDAEQRQFDLHEREFVRTEGLWS